MRYCCEAEVAFLLFFVRDTKLIVKLSAKMSSNDETQVSDGRSERSLKDSIYSNRGLNSFTYPQTPHRLYNSSPVFMF